MPPDRSPGGKKPVKVPRPNDPPEDPFFGGSYEYIEGGRTSKLRHEGQRRKEEDEGREEDGPAFPTIAKERRRHRELDDVSTQAVAGDHRRHNRRAAPQASVPLPGDRGARREHGSGESDFYSYDRDGRTATQPQPFETRQRSGELAPSLALGPYRGPPARRAPDSVGRTHAPPAANLSVAKLKSPQPPRRNSKSNPEPRKTPSPDNRVRVQPKKPLHKRIRNPPSLAGFSRFICPPWRANKSIDLPPPRSKYEMSGALGSTPSVKRRGRSPVKRQQLASNGDVLRSEHCSSHHSGRSIGSKGPTQRQGPIVKVGQNLPAVPKGRRDSRREGRLNVNV